MLKLKMIHWLIKRLQGWEVASVTRASDSAKKMMQEYDRRYSWLLSRPELVLMSPGQQQSLRAAHEALQPAIDATADNAPSATGVLDPPKAKKIGRIIVVFCALVLVTGAAWYAWANVTWVPFLPKYHRDQAESAPTPTSQTKGAPDAPCSGRTWSAERCVGR